MAKPQPANRCGAWRLEAPEIEAAAPTAKLAAAPAVAARLRGRAGDVTAAVRVARAGYVPPAARLRMRIGPCLFTADIPVARLAELEADAAVISIQPASRLDSAEGR
jgi:hypothetical protein